MYFSLLCTREINRLSGCNLKPLKTFAIQITFLSKLDELSLSRFHLAHCKSDEYTVCCLAGRPCTGNPISSECNLQGADAVLLLTSTTHKEASKFTD